ncbi:hypothetical protein SODALDRAFT_331853 [Sodiomyces alkalinus F11]|uniref:DUF8004 domain-containing protein n=1 Tax=Sodiomyces alkalinus (strain CBS 110278 / VKM F-3762 / F11) TaxID=1314773 RepID=A0A3N2PYY8_SODAK|nr:hypothetical protein SODALDRAFT_331853 [Sodiomyces alkalinus F11]ROT39743.1 hypothetical protein SODALDRAFT_331853 [Sodiomyces alkalinus F11]
MTSTTDDQSRPSSAHIHRKPLGHRTTSSTTNPLDRPHPSPPPESIQSSAAFADFDLGFSPTSVADLTLCNPRFVPETPPQPARLPPPPESSLDSVSPTTQIPTKVFEATIASAAEPAPPVPPPKAPAKIVPSAMSPPSPPPPDVSRTVPHTTIENQNQTRLRKPHSQSPPMMPLPPLPPPPPPPLSHPPRRDSLVGFDEAQFRGRPGDPHMARPRSSSYHHQVRKPSLPVPGVPYRTTSPGPETRGRSTSVQRAAPPNPNTGSGVVSTSSMVNNSQSPTRDDKRGGKLRRSLLPGGRSRSGSQDMGTPSRASAWMLGQDAVGEYKTSFLLCGEKVPELWNESGTVYVYLFPRNSGCGPSFKVPTYAISASQVFNDLIQAEMGPETDPATTQSKGFIGRDSFAADDARGRAFSRPNSPPLEGQNNPHEVRLYLPGAASPPQKGHPTPGQPQPQRADFDRLIALRNLFAFLTGQPLVATRAHPTAFAAFLEISALLHEFLFTDLGGSGFGESVDMSFGFFCDQLSLADVRHSREKTIESLILAERMHAMDLYNEAFSHAVGKYTAIIDLKSGLFDQVSSHTRQKLERAHLDLVNRQDNVNLRLEQFEFPSLFSGIAASNSIAEVKSVRFGKWRAAFNKMRQFVLGYYKSTFGNWPPKASSKKNRFTESGLNRLVLKALYSDMCALYDLLVDRESLTPRMINGGTGESSEDSAMMSALRKVLTEYDTSTPPVLPPIPFDVPQIPSMRAVLETYDKLSAKEQTKFDKRIKEHELMLILHKAYNYDTNTLKVPFLSEFKAFEHSEARGKTAADLADHRVGYWLFLYVVIQSLPMLVIDAPGLQYTEGVEYFLCEPPMGNPPWLDDARQVRKMWYEVSGGAGYVELSADTVMFSVEAIYHRSHCWQAAKRWETGEEGDMTHPSEPIMSPLAPPPIFTEQDGPVLNPSPYTGPSNPSPPPGGSPKYVGRPRNASPSGRSLAARSSTYRSSIAIGLEPVPLPMPANGMPGDRGSRVVSSRGSSISDSRSLGINGAGLRGSASASNLRAQAQDPPASHPTMTFDDILGQSAPKNTNKKKKGKFF